MLIFALLLNSAFLVSAQEAFTNVSLNVIHDRGVINFTMPREVNVRHYRVEASNDNVSFEVIGTFASKGNSMLARNYKYELLDRSYKYYRIGMVGMNASLQYSAVLTAGTETPHTVPGKISEPMHSEAIVLSTK